MFVPGPGEMQIGKGAALGTKMVGKAISGAVDQGLRSFVQSGGDAKEAAEGAALGGALGAAIPVVGSILRLGARAQYAKVLSPDKGKAQQIADAKLLPAVGKGVKGVGSLLDQGKTAIGATREALAEKFTQKWDESVKAMNAAYAAVGPTAQLNLKPILADIGNFIKKETTLPNGNFANAEAKKMYFQGVEIMKDFLRDSNANAFKDASVEDIHRLRQILDKQLFEKKLYINAKTATDQINEALRDSIQKEMHKAHPSTAAVDAAVHFWSTAKNIMKSAESKQVGNEIYRHSNAVFHASRIAVGAPIGAAIGAREGYTKRGGWEGTTAGAVIGGIAGAALSEATASTLWRSVSAVAKNKVANSLAEGNWLHAANIARRALGWSILRDTKDLSKTPTVSQPPTAPPPQKKPTSTYSGDDPNGLFR